MEDNTCSKKPLNNTDYNDQDVSDEFYFNYTKLEIMEKLNLDKLDEKIERLTQTENAKEAYEIFKGLVLDAYGEKSTRRKTIS